MFTDFEFWKVVWLSSTFRESMIHAGVMMVVFLFFGYLVPRVFLKYKASTWLALNRDQRGSANAADFVLIIPFFMFMMCLFVQMAMIVNASLIVHYSAYSAARTARVHFCNRSVIKYPLGYITCDASRAENEAVRAARYVLIAASPVDESIQSNGNPPSDSLQWIANQYLERESPILIQARYAFDSRNVKVDVEPAVSSDPAIQAQYLLERAATFNSATNLGAATDRKLLNAWPVTVKVEYVKHLGVPLVGPFLSDVRRGNDHFRTIEAEITLL